MAYVIAEPCIGQKDNSCVEVCPVDAVFAQDQLPVEWAGFADEAVAFFAERVSSAAPLGEGTEGIGAHGGVAGADDGT